MSDVRFDRIEDKLDAIQVSADTVKERLASIDTTLALQHASLSHHIKRTELLEEAILPIQKHVDQVSGVLKFIGVLALIGAIVQGVVSALDYFKS